MNTTRYKNDKRLRDKLFVPNAMMHPAKGHLGLWQDIIEKYTQPGDTILDPMSGVGATLMAALMGRNVVCVELEPHFVEPMRASWEKMQQHPMLEYSMGEALILRGDARCLPLNSADCVVTSPPYENQNPHHGGGHTDFSPIGGIRHERVIQGGYTRPVSAIITSPPFQDQEPMADVAWFKEHREEFGGGGVTGHYTRPVDAIVSSPPYEASQTTDESFARRVTEGKLNPKGFSRNNFEFVLAFRKPGESSNGVDSP